MPKGLKEKTLEQIKSLEGDLVAMEKERNAAAEHANKMQNGILRTEGAIAALKRLIEEPKPTGKENGE